jgi:hypothetical protein
MEALGSASLSRREFAATEKELVPAALLAGCAFSAGTHIALAPEHLRESASLGLSFLLAAALLLAFGLGIFLRPSGIQLPLLIALLSVALIAAYVASRTAGLPVLHPEPEAVDRVGVITKAIELAVLVLSLRLYRENAAGSRLQQNRRTKR